MNVPEREEPRAEEAPSGGPIPTARPSARSPEPSSTEAPASSFRLSRLPYATRGRRKREIALALLPVLVVLGLLGLAYAVGAHRLLGTIDPRVWLLLAAGISFVVLGCIVGNRTALFFAMLFGIPLELPFPLLGSDAAVLRRRARWLASFLREKPRGYNTPGAHLAYGTIAVKIDLKRLCLRHERADLVLRELREERLREREALVTCQDAVVRALREAPDGQPEVDPRVAAASLRASSLEAHVHRIDDAILSRRLSVQDAVLAEFTRAWNEARATADLAPSLVAAVRAQFANPPGEPQTLLPKGLVRGLPAFAFEHGMFAGRVLMASLFLVTFQGPLGWALLLWVLALYVSEPVVLKLHIAFLNLLLDSPGHEMVDLRAYLTEQLPEESICRVPITVPKFSSNPAWAALSEIIDAASRRCGVRPSKVSPPAMRNGIAEAVLQVAGDDGHASEGGSTERLAAALREEIRRTAASLPIALGVRPEPSRVRLTLEADPEAVWSWIGEDAAQAFLYLERNLVNLGDTLRYAGPKLRPYFVLASNTKDPDVIEREVALVQRLQARSEAAYAGQVGFLYLHRGGEWFDFNVQLARFEATDKDFVRAVPGFRTALGARAEPPVWRPVRDAVLQGRDPDGLDAVALADAFNAILDDEAFYRAFDDFDFDALPLHLRPGGSVLEPLARRRAGEPLARSARRALNRELLLTALPWRVVGGFFKKVGNDIPVQELLVRGRTRPQAYTTRALSEHVQDPSLPSFTRAWGDFARYTGLAGTNEHIHAAILAGDDLTVANVPEVGAVVDDKNDFAPGEFEKGLAVMLHPANRHIVLGIPRINVTFPESTTPGMAGRPLSSRYLVAAQAAREIHNSSDGQSRTRVFDYASPAYGKWWKRSQPYLAHYNREVLNAAHALSHDFQQSYLVTGAADRLNGFSEALYGPTRFQVSRIARRAAPRGALVRVVTTLALVTVGLLGLVRVATDALGRSR